MTVARSSADIAAAQARAAAAAREAERRREEAARKAAEAKRLAEQAKGWQAKSDLRPSQKVAAAEKTEEVKPIPKTEAGQYAYYQDIIQKAGGKFRGGPEERNLLSFRTPTSTKVNGGEGRYDDTTVMLWKDAQGQPHVRTYQSNTDPTSHYEGSYGQDANHDGRLDLGRIPPGSYTYYKSHSDHLGNVLRSGSEFAVDRDTNHDGLFNDGAKTSTGGGSMLFHAGGNSMTGSAGCQTFAPADFQKFWKDLGNYNGPIGFTLVNGSTASGAAKIEAPKASFSETGVSYEQLHAIMPDCPTDRAKQMLPYLNNAMKEFGINTPERASAFLAQLAHESGQLKYFEELASGSAYEGRSDLGNTHPGDGVRYKGRGPIQLTGRANYGKASEALGVDLVAHPELASRPDIGFRIAGWFWKTHGLNELADKGEFSEITHRINGGYNGAESRNAYYRTAQRVLGGGLDGGPVSEGDTVPGSFNRSGETPNAGSGGRYTSNSYDSYGGRSRDPIYTDPAASMAREGGFDDWDFFTTLMLLMGMMDELPPSLANDPRFQKFLKAKGLADLPPGKIPKAAVSEYMAQRLKEDATARGGGKAGLDAAATALKQEYFPTVSVNSLRSIPA